MQCVHCQQRPCRAGFLVCTECLEEHEKKEERKHKVIMWIVGCSLGAAVVGFIAAVVYFSCYVH